MPQISVIIPVYKVEQYIKKCLDSVLNQTLLDTEIIIVDDGSPDNCYEIIKEYSEIDCRVKIVRKDNGGLSSARNAGLDIATGEYIAFVDSDDWIEPDMLECMYEAASNCGADVVICNYRMIYDDKVKDRAFKLANETINIEKIGLPEYFYKYFFPSIHGHAVWNKIYKRDIIEKNSLRFENNREIFSEDLLFNLYIFCHIKKICSVDGIFYNYFQRNGSLSHLLPQNLIILHAELVKRFSFHADRAGKLKELEHFLPIMLYDLMVEGLTTAFRTGNGTFVVENTLKNAIRSVNLKLYLKKLAIGRSASIYCSAKGTGVKDHIECRLFAIFCLCGFYRVAVKIRYNRYLS